VCTGSSDDWAEELWVRPVFYPELQLVIVVGKIIGPTKLSSNGTIYWKGSRKAGNSFSSSLLSFCVSKLCFVLYYFYSLTPKVNTGTRVILHMLKPLEHVRMCVGTRSPYPCTIRGAPKIQRLWGVWIFSRWKLALGIAERKLLRGNRQHFSWNEVFSC
jgi:hypothetical protein